MRKECPECGKRHINLFAKPIIQCEIDAYTDYHHYAIRGDSKEDPKVIESMYRRDEMVEYLTYLKNLQLRQC